MRYVFGTTDLRLPADLRSNFAAVDIAAVCGSLSETTKAVANAPASAPIDVVIIESDLQTTADRENDVSLASTLLELRRVRPDARIMVISTSAQLLPEVEAVGASTFVAQDRERAATNMAAMLGLVSKADNAFVIAIAGLQGGAGRTFLARHIAAGINNDLERSTSKGGVLLWELDLKHPTIAFDQDVDLVSSHHGRRTIARLLNAGPIDDDSMPTIANSILSAKETRLEYDLLLAPFGLREVMATYQSYPNLVELRQRLSRILEVIRRNYRVVVIDTGTDMITDPGASVALSTADAICFVATPSPAGLSSIMSMRHIIAPLNAGRRTRLVLNRIRREDAAYARICRNQAEGVVNILAEIPEGIAAATINTLGPKLLDIGR